jgi:drug/metabolite transporter (DMT)-like permease
VDGIGVRLSGSPAGYVGWLLTLESLCVPAWAIVRRRQALRETPRKVVVAGLAAGALAVLAYGLVLWAQTRGDLAPIAALRETSVIFGALIAAIAFKEPFGRTRVLAAALIAAGILILNLALLPWVPEPRTSDQAFRSPASLADGRLPRSVIIGAPAQCR